MSAPASPAPLLLCCLLWARPGAREAMAAYETRVIALLADHGAACTTRVGAREPVPDGPDEVQVYRFPDRAALEAYLADPRRTALTADRDAAVARTVLFEVADVQPPSGRSADPAG